MLLGQDPFEGHGHAAARVWSVPEQTLVVVDSYQLGLSKSANSGGTVVNAHHRAQDPAVTFFLDGSFSPLGNLWMLKLVF